jgi:hypothetical protein
MNYLQCNEWWIICNVMNNGWWMMNYLQCNEWCMVRFWIATCDVAALKVCILQAKVESSSFQVKPISSRWLFFFPEQGDQMSWLKNHPKCSPIHFFVKIYAQLFSEEKSGSQIWAVSAMFEKLPKKTITQIRSIWSPCPRAQDKLFSRQISVFMASPEICLKTFFSPKKFLFWQFCSLLRF